MEGIGPFNVGKKREEVLSLLKTFFPQMEDFEGELKKYSLTLAKMEQENAALTKQAQIDNDKNFQAVLERSTLMSEVENLRRMVKAIPEDLRRQLQAQTKTGQRWEGR